jgi:hypothetical protein
MKKQNAVTRRRDPQERKQEKTIAHVRSITDCSLPYPLALAVEDMLRAGLKQTNIETEHEKGYRLHCNAEYHFARFTGEGATLAPLLYASPFTSRKTAAISSYLCASLRGISMPKRRLCMQRRTCSLSRNFGRCLRNEMAAPLDTSPLVTRMGRTHEGAILHRQVRISIPRKQSANRVGRRLYGITGEKFFDDVIAVGANWVPMSNCASGQRIHGWRSG